MNQSGSALLLSRIAGLLCHACVLFQRWVLGGRWRYNATMPISADEIVEFLRYHPGAIANICICKLLMKQAGVPRQDRLVEMMKADELMREVSAIGLIRSEKQDDGTVRWFVA